MGTGQTTYLDRIVEHHRDRAAADVREPAALREQALARTEPIRGFRSALIGGAQEHGLVVIAEVKRRSPSKGALAPGLDPAAMARAYAAGGASCLSVLTDGPHFGGSFDDLRAARAATDLPVLRKDFTVDVRDVYDAAIEGADCVLLIAAALSDDELAGCHNAAREVGIDALVEIHDEAELVRALSIGATLIGVNQRDLHTFEVDTNRAVQVGASMPAGVIRVAESGVRGADDAAVLARAGFHAVLVGETLVRSADPAAEVRALINAGRTP